MPRPNEHRQTLLPTTAKLDGVGLTSPQHRLAEKQRELQAFHRLRSQSQEMSGNFQDLAGQLGNLASGGEGEEHLTRRSGSLSLTLPLAPPALERVVENWANVFRAVHLAVGESH